MPNVFIKPQVIAATALGLLQRQIILPNLVWKDAVAGFTGVFGDTISIRVPGRLTARTRPLRASSPTRNIVMDTLTETKVDVTLDTDVYQAVPITDEELTLDIVDFGTQILSPQTRAVAEGLENGLVTSMREADYDLATVVMDPDDMYGSLVDARKALNDENVAITQRAVVVGSSLEAAILKDPNLRRYDGSGQVAEDMLSEAKIGRLAGFDVYQSNALDPDEGYAFHKSAFIMATRAPVVPDGASFGSVQSYMGLAMRWLRDYDFTTTTDRSLVDTYCGFSNTVEGDGRFVRAVKLSLGDDNDAVGTTDVSAIDVTPATSTKAAGQTTQLTVKDQHGQTINPQNVTFTSGTPAHATVSEDGLVTFVATGASVITAAYGDVTDTMTATTS